MSLHASERPAVILTVGHSNRTLEELLALLEAHEVAHVVDIRTIPRSRHNPQFDREQLARDLHEPESATPTCRRLAGSAARGPTRQTGDGTMPRSAASPTRC